MTRARVLKAAIMLLGLSLTLASNYLSYLTDFNLVPGDRGDTRLNVFIQEHWLHVFQGRDAFYNLGMFYPDQRTLGYSDAEFLFSLPYALLRALGSDYFTSYQLVLVFMTVLGYATSLLLLRRALKLAPGFAVLGSALLTSLNATQFQISIGKLIGFYFCPALIGLLYIYVTGPDKTGWRAWLSLTGFGAGLGLLFFTSYYPAWFFLFTLLLFAVLVFARRCLGHGVRDTLRRMAGFVRAHWPQLVAGLAVFVLSLVPFGATYAPVVLARSSRTYSLVLDYLPTIKDIVNVSRSNYVWSPLLSSLHFKFGNREVQMGSPLLILSLFAGFCTFQAGRLARRRQLPSEASGRFIFDLSLAALAIAALTMKFHELSLWYVVYSLVPGASALRAVGRFLIVFDIIAVVVVVYAMDHVYDLLKARDLHANRVLIGGMVILGMALAIEQVNGAPFRLNKQVELSLLNRFGTPATGCKAFFINNAPSSDLPIGYYQLDAMMVSMRADIPTVNGYSGIAPNEVFTLVPAGIEYTYKILRWLDLNHATQGICELDYQSGAFRPVDFSTEYPKYQQLNRASYLEAFSTFHAAAVRFLAQKNDPSGLYPQQLEARGYLDPSFGYKSGASYKWIQDRYWVGALPCGKAQCFGIGIIGSYSDIQDIIETYGARAYRVYFPYPAAFSPEAKPSQETSGELLITFTVTGSQP
jgi:hypothetical protein